MITITQIHAYIMNIVSICSQKKRTAHCLNGAPNMKRQFPTVRDVFFFLSYTDDMLAKVAQTSKMKVNFQLFERSQSSQSQR